MVKNVKDIYPSRMDELDEIEIEDVREEPVEVREEPVDVRDTAEVKEPVEVREQQGTGL